MKRVFDLVVSLAGLMVLSPLFGIIALLIKADDGGPVFFRQVRIGHLGGPFCMWKFRSMVGDAERLGRSLTVGRDPRITRIGSFLRATKLDELPQLVNVVAGEMSLVGPRPEVQRYVDLYTPEQREVLALRPGITDPASLKYRDESEELALHADPEAHYVHVVMPDKIRINLEYVRTATLYADVRTILATLGILDP